MAEVSYLRLVETVEDAEQEDIFAFDSVFPFDDHHIHHAGAFDLEICDWIGASGSASFDQVFESENQVTFVMDLLQHRVQDSHVLEIGSFEPVPILEYDFRMIDRNVEEIGGNSYELDGGEFLGLGTVFDGIKRLGIGSGDDEDANFGGFIVSDELLVAGGENANNSDGSSTRERNRFSGGSNLVDFGTDSEDDFLEDDNPDVDGNGDMNIAFWWDSLQLEDERDGNEEFEWEEVQVLIPEEPISIAGLEDQIEERGDQLGSRNLEWEVLLNVNNNLERNDDYIYTVDYEMTIGVAGVENPSVGRPPASKSALESLPSVIVTDEDVLNGNALCVVCKDDMGVGEQAKQLPCSHCYHGDCIISWLEISNTCPVCRHELPTDDLDYEALRAARAQ